MPRGHHRLPPALGPLSAAVLAFATAGCAALAPLPPSAPPPTAEAVGTEYRHDVYFDTDEDEPDAPESARLDTFLAQISPGTTFRFRLAGRADERASDLYNLDLSARRAASVGRRVRDRLGPGAEVTTSALGERSPITEGAGERAWSRNRSVEIVATGRLVRLPGCPDWSRDPAYDPRNLPLSNLGCANAVNLGLMVADPADLAAGREVGPADATREADAVLRYRSDKVKPLEKQTVSK